MRNVLVTGMSGTGKSTALAELAKRGFRVVETDRAPWSEWSDADGGYVWREELIEELLARDEVVVKPIARGDCTVHNERVMHGSGGNQTAGYRRAYIVAYRSEDTVRIERELGFTHSHNDEREVLDAVGVEGQTA